MDGELNKKTILIADDAEPNRLLLKKIFAAEFFVEEAANGLEVLEKLRQLSDVAVLILDIMMPQMDGFDVLKAMQKDEYFRTIPTVMITANNEEDVQIRALSYGATDIMTKPFNPQIILHRIKNIMARKESERLAEQNRAYELELRLMDTDEKSGLFNKNAFHRYTAKMLRKNPNKNFVLIRWDIDNFKVYNDWFGTEAGDAYLKKIGDFFRCYKQNNSTVKTYARYDADHFVCCQEADGFEPEKVTKVIDDFMSQLKTLDFEYTPRVGLYFITEPTLDVALMCDRALLALRSIKDSYGKRYAWYDDSMRATMLEQQEILNEMEFALKDGQFVPYFQPQYNYENGNLIGAEALVRWEHPRKGAILPCKFIPLFERNGFISRMDEYMWEQVCILLENWRDEGLPLVPISVNVSRRDIYNPHLVENILNLLHKYNLSHELLHLEITESAYTQNAEQLVNTVNLLRKHGLEVHMDDFGSGYSSLNMLQNVPVDILKLDMRFLGNDYKNERSGNVLNAVVRMATALRLPVLAEGVETKEQADFLKSIGCLLMQGYFFSRPIKVENFEALLKNKQTNSGLTENNLESIENSIDLLSFSSQSTLLFNCFVGGAAVVEYDRGNKSLTALRINDGFFEEIGINRAEYMEKGQSVFDFYEGENRQLVFSMFEEAIKTGKHARCEVMAKPKIISMDYRWFKLCTKLLMTSVNKHFFYVAIENITKAKRKSIEKEKEVEWLTAVVNSVSGVVLVLDVAEKVEILYSNVAVDVLLGYSQIALKECFGNDFLLLIHPEDRNNVEAWLRQQKFGEKIVKSVTCRQICEDGSWRLVKITGKLMGAVENQFYLCALVEAVEMPKEIK
ncbi:phytochrome-like protein cph2 [Anaerotignum neopropionicum]|uniref:Stage 0 sporulation protein A homolog n=1 Tax=Anaerotignum neopropionicum TaxID=36847 RepID=A0A136WF38_9FIRM|nr:EAL domain-containing protein [Anaerotignum neopropionicum]KXL53104.1 phytochrome-like protein cph2 [Anaerotignum neopropionicum]